MKYLSLPLFVIAWIFAAIVFGFAIAGTIMVLTGMLPVPETPPELIYITSAPEIRVVTATPAPTALTTPEASQTAGQLFLVATPTSYATIPPAFSAQLATAYPMGTPTPLALAYPTARPDKPERVRRYGRDVCFGKA